MIEYAAILILAVLTTGVALFMLFVVFDVELVFLFPWAVLVRELGVFGLVEMGFFLAIVVAGFVYAWKQRALEFK